MPSNRLTLPLAGLGCAAGEARTIERVLRDIPGVASAYLNPANDTAYIEYDPRLTDPMRVVSALRRAGFRRAAVPADPQPAARRRTALVFAGFAVVAGFLLATEHRAHLFGLLPFVFLLACPLLHLFSHGGHGGHGGGQHGPAGGEP